MCRPVAVPSSIVSASSRCDDPDLLRAGVGVNQDSGSLNHESWVTPDEAAAPGWKRSAGSEAQRSGNRPQGSRRHRPGCSQKSMSSRAAYCPARSGTRREPGTQARCPGKSGTTGKPHTPAWRGAEQDVARTDSGEPAFGHRSIGAPGRHSGTPRVTPGWQGLPPRLGARPQPNLTG